MFISILITDFLELLFQFHRTERKRINFKVFKSNYFASCEMQIGDFVHVKFLAGLYNDSLRNSLVNTDIIYSSFPEIFACCKEREHGPFPLLRASIIPVTSNAPLTPAAIPSPKIVTSISYGPFQEISNVPSPVILRSTTSPRLGVTSPTVLQHPVLYLSSPTVLQSTAIPSTSRRNWKNTDN